VRGVVSLLVTLAAAAPASAVAASPLSVALNRTTVATRIGQKFDFSTTIRNGGERPVPGVVAHLNIVSLDPSVYVDPEDWSSRRTRYLGTVASQSSKRIRWDVQAVNSGHFVVYVAVVDRSGAGTVIASKPLRASVTQQRTLNSGGVIPLAVAIPGALSLLILFLRRRRRALG
jgi:hypothetical protein